MLKMQPLVSVLLGAVLFAQTPVQAAGNQLPAREEIPAGYKWQLNDIYADEDLWQKDYDLLKNLMPKLAGYQGKLSGSAKTLLDCLKTRDEMGKVSGKLFAYARMHRDENTADAKYQAMTGKVEALLAETGAAGAFIEPEILSIPDNVLASFRKEEAGLKEYSFYFENLSRQKKHVLTPAEEAILSRSAEATQTPEDVFNMLSHADLQFPIVKDEQGKEVQLSEGRYRSFIMSPDRRVREEAFTNLLGTYAQFRNTFAATLNGNVKKNLFYSRSRHYPSALAAALEGDNVPDEVYENLINTVHANLAPLHRYVALKKRVLQLDQIHMYDLYAPLVPEVRFDIKYEDAKKMVQEGLHPLGPEYLGILDKGLSGGWIDVYENKGKQTGAYSWGTYGVHPFVLLNYNDRYDDVSTLAHEMGHAIHSYYSQANQPFATASYTTFCAEVASTTNEILLLDYMLSTTTDKKQRMYLINQYLEAVRATVYRQTLFAEFEKLIHARAEGGETITADMLDTLWHELNVKYYGPEIVVDKTIDIEWARIPHFYWSFYVYQYVTGYSAATTLAEKIQQEGEPAQRRYIDFLKSGGSDYSLNILKRAGVDMSSPKPIEITLAKFNSRLTELEGLLENQSE